MAKCWACDNTRVLLRGDGVRVPCWYCGGMEPSCCDGPIGEPDQEPTDPNASRPEQSTPPMPSYEGRRLKSIRSEVMEVCRPYIDPADT